MHQGIINVKGKSRIRSKNISVKVTGLAYANHFHMKDEKGHHEKDKEKTLNHAFDPWW